MKSTIPIISFVVTWLCLVPLVSAESIYTWVDKKGIKQFSNEPPPADVEHYQRYESLSQSQAEQNAPQERRKSYDTMVEEAKREALRTEQERLSRERAREAAQKHDADTKLAKKVDTERQRLKGLMEKARNRGLSRTYSQGMRQNKVDSIQKQLDQLKTSPQTYFKDKAMQGSDAIKTESGY